MTSGISLIGLALSVVYVGLAVTFAVFADRLFKSRPIGLWGDIAVASGSIALFAIFLGNGWHRMLIELNDAYPAYFAVAYMPIVAFVSIGFVRSLVPLLPARAVQPVSAMAMAGDAAGSGPIGSAQVAAEPAASGEPVTAKPQSALAKWSRLGVGIMLLVVFAVIGLARFATRNDLPGCDARATKNTLSDIFQSRKVEVKRYNDIKTNSTAEALTTCTAFMTMMDDHLAEIDYQIGVLEDKTVQVRITAARDK
jgi:hypothetical protein